MKIYVVIDENALKEGFDAGPDDAGTSLKGVYDSLEKAIDAVRKIDKNLSLKEEIKNKLWFLYDKRGYFLYSIKKTRVK